MYVPDLESFHHDNQLHETAYSKKANHELHNNHKPVHNQYNYHDDNYNSHAQQVSDIPFFLKYPIST